MAGRGRGWWWVPAGDPEGAPPQDNGPIRTRRTFYPPFHHHRRRRCCTATLATSALRRAYFSPLRSHQGGFPLPTPVPSSSRRPPVPSRSLPPADSTFRHRRGGKEVRRRGSRSAGVCAVRNFYAGDGAVCRGSISGQHPLDFQGFRIDSNSASRRHPRRNFILFLVRGILVPACLPARNIHRPPRWRFFLFMFLILPLTGRLTSHESAEINDRFIRSEVARVHRAV